MNKAESLALAGQARMPAEVTRRPLPIATVTGVAAILLLFAWIGLGGLFTSAPRGDTSLQATAHTAGTINPLLIIRPHTITQRTHDGALDLTLSTSPLIPGPNRLVVALSKGTQHVKGARLSITATMIGMAMRPVRLTLRELGQGHYTVAAPLSMFGQWRLSLTVAPRHAAPIRQTFLVSLDLPRGLYTALRQHTESR